MDPIHPAKHDRQEVIYDTHYSDADKRRVVEREAMGIQHRSDLAKPSPAEFDLPEFDPSSVMARMQQQRAQQQVQANP